VLEIQTKLEKIENAKADADRDHILLEATHKGMRHDFIATVQLFISSLGSWDRSLNNVLGGEC